MGVPHLFAYLSKNYPKCIKKYKNSSSTIYNDYKIDTLLIDGNACIYPVARKYYYESTEKKRLCGKQNTIKIGKEKTDEEFFQLFFKSIEDLFLRVKPKIFLFGIDGVVNLSKSAEQRKRRFLSVPHPLFNTYNISVGTPWMKKLHLFLLKAFKDIAFKYPNTNFIYESYLVEGECEHRLINYIKTKAKNNDEVCMIHANDADVISLMLGLQRPNCFILRDRVDDNNDQCSVIDISQLREELITNYLPISNDFISDNDKINSIIFLWYLVGMDFLPKCPSLEIFNNGMEDISSSLKKVIYKFGSIVKINNNCSNNSKIDINITALIYWMREIAKRDIIVLQRKATDTSYHPDPILIRNIISDTNKIIANEKKYKDDYNITHFKNNLNDACNEYLRGLWWTFEYYTFGTPSWNWYYPYHYSPWINDIADFLESDKFKIPIFKLGKPVPVNLQLLFILPPHAFDLLPEPLRILKDKYPHLFPTKFEIDKSGTQYDWEQKVLLPFADFKLLKKEYYKLYPKKQNKKNAILDIMVII